MTEIVNPQGYSYGVITNEALVLVPPIAPRSNQSRRGS